MFNNKLALNHLLKYSKIYKNNWKRISVVFNKQFKTEFTGFDLKIKLNEILSMKETSSTMKILDLLEQYPSQYNTIGKILKIKPQTVYKIYKNLFIYKN
ncbi:hypothetical protein NUSPORA_01493 [Nucleospora cyclopteri]